MAATLQNGISVSNTSGLALNPTADYDLDDGTLKYGLLTSAGAGFTEGRGSKWTASVANTETTYEKGEPFFRRVYERFAGFGQLEDDKATGGVGGQGGNPDQYFDSNGYTLREQLLMPGLARNLVYPSTPVSPCPAASSNLEDCEIPRGLLPWKTIGTSTVAITAANAGTIAVTQMRALFKFEAPSVTGITVGLTIVNNTTSIGKNFFSSPLSGSDFTGWKWITLTSTAGALNITNGNSLAVNINSGGGAPNGIVSAIWPRRDIEGGLNGAPRVYPGFNFVCLPRRAIATRCGRVAPGASK
jgi:hypothetical protein